MDAYPADWALCGGWAVDAWLGRKTRDHGDVDIVVFVEDQDALFEQLAGWQLVCHDARAPVNSEPWDGGPLISPGHLHGRIDRGEPPPVSGIMLAEDGFILDVQINDRDSSHWLLMDEPRLARSLPDAVRTSLWGIPTVVPEVLLFYKAIDLRRRDRTDFAALLPALAPAQRAWLREAVAAMGHPWSRELAAAGAGGAR
jgi:hypothetical protein